METMTLVWLLVFTLAALIFFVIMTYKQKRTISDLEAEMKAMKELSVEDILTGFNNRRGFDLEIENIIMNAESYDDVLLMFLNVHTLKMVNDKHGHQAGDELLLSAAYCVHKVFAQEGMCFRIDGNEFAVVILNPKRSISDYRSNWEKETESFNRSRKIRVSATLGFSRLRDSDGYVKSSSQWKTQADEALKTYADSSSTRG